MKYVNCYFLFVQINVVYTYSYCHLTNKDIKIYKYIYIILYVHTLMCVCQTHITVPKRRIYDQHTSTHTHCSKQPINLPVKLALELAKKHVQMFNAVTQKSKYLTKYSSNHVRFFISYMEEYYLTNITIVVTQSIFLSCSKIDLKIVDRLRFFPKQYKFIM